VAGRGGSGKGGKKRERERRVWLCLLSSLSIPFQFLPLPPLKGVHRRSDAELCPVEDEWGEEKNVPGWNKKKCSRVEQEVCKTVCAHPRFDYY
jgi:hypothetical protein